MQNHLIELKKQDVHHAQSGLQVLDHVKDIKFTLGRSSEEASGVKKYMEKRAYSLIFLIRSLT